MADNELTELEKKVAIMKQTEKFLEATKIKNCYAKCSHKRPSSECGLNYTYIDTDGSCEEYKHLKEKEENGKPK